MRFWAPSVVFARLRWLGWFAAAQAVTAAVFWLMLYLFSALGDGFDDPLGVIVGSKPALTKEITEGLVVNANGVFELSMWAVLGVYLLVGFTVDRATVASNVRRPLAASLLVGLGSATALAVYSAILYRVRLGRQIDFSQVNLELLDGIIDFHLSCLLYLTISGLLLIVWMVAVQPSKEP